MPVATNNFITVCLTCKTNICRCKTTLHTKLENLLISFNKEPDKAMRTFTNPEKHPGDKAVPLLPMRSIDIKNTSSSSESVLAQALRADAKSVRIDHQRAHWNDEGEEEVVKPEQDRIIKLTGYKYRAHNIHKFIIPTGITFASWASPGGDYSQLIITIWIDSKHFSKSFQNDRYRIVLNMVYDREADLWCVSARILRRPGYSSNKDEDEGGIDNRLCLPQELRHEIKTMLLFLGIAPMVAYKIFRKTAFDAELTITRSDYGFTTVESADNIISYKNLEKTPSYHTYNAHGGSTYTPMNQKRISSHDEYKDEYKAYSSGM